MLIMTNTTVSPTTDCSRLFGQTTIDIFNFVTFSLSVIASVLSVAYTIYTCCNKRVKIKENIHTDVTFSENGDIKEVSIRVDSSQQRHPHEAIVDLRRADPQAATVEQVMEFATIQRTRYIGKIERLIKAAIDDPLLDTREALAARWEEIITDHDFGIKCTGVTVDLPS